MKTKVPQQPKQKKADKNQAAIDEFFNFSGDKTAKDYSDFLFEMAELLANDDGLTDLGLGSYLFKLKQLNGLIASIKPSEKQVA